MAQGPLYPSPRYGHGASVFDGALYVLGGFSSRGLTGIVEEDDMWRLRNYAGGGAWTQIMPSSASPSGRAYFGFWRSGYQLYMQGGEGSGSVLQDTWVFNFYTQESADPPNAKSRLARSESCSPPPPPFPLQTAGTVVDRIRISLLVFSAFTSCPQIDR
jgi:hypothetical protein